MAIDLFCYSSLPPNEVKGALSLMAAQHQGLFHSRFLISEVGEANPVHKEVSLEYGLAANCEFIVSLNDKSAADLVPTAMAIVKCTLGDGNVIVLSDGGVLR